MSTTNPQLTELSNQFAAISADLQNLITDINAEEFGLRREPNRWSIAECIAHLNIFSGTMLPIILSACEDARSKGMTKIGILKMDTVGRLLKYSLEPPYRIRVSTTPVFTPGETEPMEKLVPEFLAWQQQLVVALNAADGLDLNRIKISSPVAQRVRYNLYSCFNVVAAHQRRHLWQASQVKKQIKNRTN